MKLIERITLLALLTAPLLGASGCSGAVDDGAIASTTENFGLAPAGFVITPHGFFHPSCVVQVAATEQQQPDGRILGANGVVRQTTPCGFPHYDRHGKAIAPDAVTPVVAANSVVATDVADLPDVNGWVESSSDDAHGALQWISANWQVPAAPAIQGSQVVYYFPGIEDINNVQTIVQPVLGWMNGGWSIASWNCCKDGNVTHSALIPVSSGDQLYGYTYGTNCDGNGQCPNWTIYTQDQSNNTSTTLNSSSFGQVFNWSFGGVLEAYGIQHCAQYPANGSLSFTNIVTAQVGGNAVSINWPGGNGNQSPNCGYTYSGGTSGVIGHVTLDTTPTTMYTPNGATSCGAFSAGQGIIAGQSLTSCDGRFKLSLQLDGNLVLYQGGSALWASNTSGSTGFAAVMQSDGNFVLYDMSGHALWAAGTYNHGGSRLALQNDGNLVVYPPSGGALWASNTCCR
jgi:hypothetical protein